MSEPREKQQVDPQADGDASVQDLPAKPATDAADVRGGTTTERATFGELTISKPIDRSSP